MRMRNALSIVCVLLCGMGVACSKAEPASQNTGSQATPNAPSDAANAGDSAPKQTAGTAAVADAANAGTGASAGAGGANANSNATNAGASAGQAGTAAPGTGQPSNPGDRLTVMEVAPTARSIKATSDAAIVVSFDRAVQRDSVTAKTFWAYGRWSGPVRDGAYAFSNDDKTVTLTAPRKWTAGDRVTVILANTLMAADGARLRDEGYSFQFTTAAAGAPMMFTEIERQTVRSADNAPTRAYGGSAADLDGDGHLDLMVVNEDSLDLRIFMNKGDGSGSFRPFTDKPIVALDQRASPSETTDFNGDGKVDLVTANLDANNLSVLIGNGDGTFTESQKIRVGEEPRGVAVIDADGDGDIDIINTNANSDNVSLLLNDGTGKFPENEGPGFVFWDAGEGKAMVRREFGLFSGDMDEDGILDLVIGANGVGAGDGAGTAISRGVGNGTFAFVGFYAPMTTPWQLAVGDLNGDGHEDVVTSDGNLRNSMDTVTTLLGDGAGMLTPLQAYSDNIMRPFAVDLGDLDGDGDLDVVVSNYFADWQVLKNDGTGQVTLAQTVNPTRAASCALLLDIDADNDLDLVLIDEEQDEIVVMRQ
jgi:hypothetical protein